LPLQTRLLDGVMAELAEAERTVGDDDGRLEPRHVAGASPRVREVMAAVWRVAGTRTLSLEEIRRVLPRALVAVLSGPWPDAELSLRATEDLVAWTAARFEEEVLMTHRLSPSLFPNAYGFSYPQFQALQGLWPEVFAAKVERRPRSSPNLDTFVGEVPAKKLEAWSLAWTAVAARQKTISVFLAETGLSLSELRRLRQEAPERFPALGSKVTLAVGQHRLSLELAKTWAGFEAQAREDEPFITFGRLVEQWNEDGERASRLGKMSEARYQSLRSRHPEVLHKKERGSAEAQFEKTIAELLSRRPPLSREAFLSSAQQALGPLRPWRLQRLERAYQGGAAEPGQPKGSPSDRSTLPILSIYALAIRAAEPGATWEQAVEPATKVVAARGVSPARDFRPTSSRSLSPRFSRGPSRRPVRRRCGSAESSPWTLPWTSGSSANFIDCVGAPRPRPSPT
jgi:hypothetical protein